MSRIRRAIAAASVAAALGAVPIVVDAAPAAASGTVWVYISLPTFYGNCPGGGSVRYLHVATFSPSASDYRSDAGDDLVYIAAGKNENTTVVAKGLCYKGSKSYWGPDVSRTIKATRTGQTWWIGPTGVSHN